MAIKGNLETFDLSSLLQMINYERKTGRLRIVSGKNEVQIMLQDGDVVFATESRKTNRLGLLLMTNGLIDQKVLDSCLELSRKRDQSIGKTLVQERHITSRQLNDFLLEQAENSIYNVFLWESGEFVYNDAEVNLKRIVGKKLDTMNILLEASRRIDELRVLKKQIPDDQAVVKPTGGSAANPDIELNAEEQRLLSLADGSITVRQILEQTGYDDFTGYRGLNALISAGQIKLTQALTREELAAQALWQLQGVDSRQFRETLDHLGLSRSSVLRLAFTRIFREAMDSAQLLEAVENESGKLSSSPEQIEIQQLRDAHRSPVLNAILELLWQAVTGETVDK